MTQPTTETQDAQQDQGKPERRQEITRVRVLAAPFLQYDLGKLWPQGPQQTEYAQASFELQTIGEWLTRNRDSREWVQRAEEYRTKKKELEQKREKLKTAEMPVECRVSEINIIDGDLATSTPACVEIVGVPFGRWQERQVAMVERVPVSVCVTSTRYPVEELVEYLEQLHAEPSEEEDEEDETDEDEGDEEDETDEDEGDEEDETDEATDATPSEPSPEELVGRAAIVVSLQAQVVEYNGAPHVMIPAGHWEPLRLAVEGWMSAQGSGAPAAELPPAQAGLAVVGDGPAMLGVDGGPGDEP